MRRALLFLAVAVLCVAAGLVWRHRRAATLGGAADVQQAMQELAPLAVQHARTAYGLDLDYAPDSIKSVELALGRLHDDLAASRTRRSEAETLAKRYGAYVGETIRRRFGGYWSRDHAAAGRGSFPLRVEGRDVFPVAWCLKRVANGPEDNVWNKYQLGVAAPLPGIGEGQAQR
jgi:hypothetical protein